MEIKIINNNPNNFMAVINDSLELSIHYQDGIRAMDGLPNIDRLEQYWKGGVHQSVSANEAKVREILMTTQK